MDSGDDLFPVSYSSSIGTVSGICDPYIFPAEVETAAAGTTGTTSCEHMQEVCNFYKLKNDECVRFL